MSTTNTVPYSIDEIAQMTGTTPRTLRWYEEIGLLPPPDRTGGGHRKYTEADVRRIERIRDLKELLGLSLADLHALLGATELLDTLRAEYCGDPDPAHRLGKIAAAHALLAQQIETVESRIARLGNVRDEYHQLQRRLEAERDHLRAVLADDTGRTTA